MLAANHYDADGTAIAGSLHDQDDAGAAISAWAMQMLH